MMYMSDIVPGEDPTPIVQELSALSDEMRYNLTPEDIHAVSELLKKKTASFQRLSNLQQPLLPVKYPRGPGYKPTKGDNLNKAWAWRCDLKGADSGKLSGKSVCIKDCIAVADVPMAGGSSVLDGYIPEFDSTVVTRILDEGGRITGKAACENLCYSGASFTSRDGPIANPHDELRTSGGSSSGCAVLVSSGEVDMAVGGDQAGSIRVPASWSGIVGLKPTFGLVPYSGAMSMEPTLDYLGPMARTVTDCALLLEVISGFDEGRDSRQNIHQQVPEYSKLVDSGVAGMRIGILKEGLEVCKEDDVVELVRREVQKLRDAGALVEEVSIPLHRDGQDIWGGIALQGNYNCMLKGNGYGYFRRGLNSLSLQDALHRGVAERPCDMSKNHRTQNLIAEYVERKYHNRFYTMAQNMSLILTRAYDDALKSHDVLVMPTLPYKAPLMPPENAPLTELLRHAGGMFPNTCPFNSTGHPALSINAGFSDSLPVGMQIVGRHFEETSVLRVARSYEKIRDQGSKTN